MSSCRSIDGYNDVCPGDTEIGHRVEQMKPGQTNWANMMPDRQPELKLMGAVQVVGVYHIIGLIPAVTAPNLPFMCNHL